MLAILLYILCKNVNAAIKHSRKIQASFYLELFSVFDSFSKAAAVVMPSVQPYQPNPHHNKSVANLGHIVSTSLSIP